MYVTFSSEKVKALRPFFLQSPNFTLMEPPGPKTQERFFRIAFPEKPGALRRFLDTISDHYNISLFHYRSSGDLIGGTRGGARQSGGWGWREKGLHTPDRRYSAPQ